MCYKFTSIQNDVIRKSNSRIMSNKELIISLIQQDLKHSQLVLGLDELGMEASDKHCLDILDIVYNLMQVPSGTLNMIGAGCMLPICKNVKLSE